MRTTQRTAAGQGTAPATGRPVTPAADQGTGRDEGTRRLATAALAGTVVFAGAAPLLAVAYHATPEGAESGEAAVVRAWEGPLRALLGPALDAVTPEAAYRALGLALVVAAGGLVCGALALGRARRGRDGRGERACRRGALAGYGFLAMGTLVTFVDPSSDLAFLALVVPGMLLTLLGSTALGVVLLRRRVGPVAARVLLAAAIPVFAAVSTVAGHNAAGMLGVFAGWAVLAAWLRRA